MTLTDVLSSIVGELVEPEGTRKTATSSAARTAPG